MRRHRQNSRGITLLELMIVTILVSLMIGLTFSTASAGLDSIRLRSAADSVSAILSRSINRVERAQEPVEIVFNRDAGTVSARGVTPRWKQDLKLSDGISISAILPAPPLDDSVERAVLLMPGAAFPGITIELANRRGQRRRVRIDPVVGAPRVEAPPAEGEDR